MPPWKAKEPKSWFVSPFPPRRKQKKKRSLMLIIIRRDEQRPHRVRVDKWIQSTEYKRDWTAHPIARIHPSIHPSGCNAIMQMQSIHRSCIVMLLSCAGTWDSALVGGRPAKKVSSERDRQTESGSCTNSASPSSHSHPHIISLRLTPPYCVRCDAHAGTQCLAFAPPVPGMPSDQLVVFVLLCCAADREGKGPEKG